MAWTTPITATGATAVDTTWQNTYVRDNSNFLYKPPRARATASTPTLCATATFTSLNWYATTYDNDTMHAGAGAQAYLTATTAGVYAFEVSVALFDSGGAYEWALRLQRAGTTINQSPIYDYSEGLSGANSVGHFSGYFSATAGQNIAVQFCHDAGSSFNLGATSAFHYFQLHWIGGPV